MATTKKSNKVSAVESTKPAAKRGKKALTISIDLDALEQLYKRRYEITLDGGDTKGGSIRRADGDTKGGIIIRPAERRTKTAAKKPAAKKRSAKAKA
ncbi:hypothetical protein SAMN03159335_07443 [Burkholderia cepacia]|uniref:hypothetical protein n=1 Tax=Burkholderia cepacia complex TaxID=87882 RepID=UPI0008B3A02C|nr:MULTISPECIES: hypothetical protein [Burkholderia cepacia complex]SEU45949.1 hypothetical protein SAMN03159335_07443 [Burkholderia cepacia]